jgi:hypothetical protein
LGTLTGGDKKDVIIANKIYTNFANSITNVVVIFGWHQLNGNAIQPVYNGHEETYADYSHGIRLIQMDVTVDGLPNTLTNVLGNASLAGLISSNVVTKPRYTLAAMPPAITSQPASQTVMSNSTVTLRGFAVGNKPMTYQWRWNGSNIPGATTNSLDLTNVQPSQSGTYTLVVSNSVGNASSIPAILKVTNSIYPVLFSDTFETNSSALWDLFWGAGNGVADYTIDWAFDYSREATMINGAGYFIPPAPNSGTGGTRGVRLTVNNNDTNGIVAAVNIYPKNARFSNDYSLKFDMWINYPGNAAGAGATGSTEHALFGINHLGTQPNWAATSASSTDGLWFGVDGEGGVSADYRAFVGNPNGVQTELLGPASGLTHSDSTNSSYQTLFPSSRFETAGAPGKNWVEVEVRQVGTTITWLMNGTVVAQRTNSSAFTSGKIMLGLMDVFPSIASPSYQSFVLFDNVRVENLGQTLQSPSITLPPQPATVNAGANAMFTVGANGSAPLVYQWSFNNQPLAGATNTSLQLTNVQAADAGTYSVSVSNSAGFATANATLTVISEAPRFVGANRLGTGAVELSFAGDNGVAYIIESSTNLVAWTPVSVIPITNGAFTFLDPEAIHFAFRFYRAHSGNSALLTDFESSSVGSAPLFLKPSSSGSTTNFLDLNTGDYLRVTNLFPGTHTSSNVLGAWWTFKTGTTNPWLRLTTFNAPALPNPIIGSNQALQIDLFCDHDVYVALGIRETNPTGPIGGDGGTSGSIEWVGGTTANTNPPKGRLVTSNEWTTLTFFLPQEPVRAFTGNGVLETTTGKFVLEHLPSFRLCRAPILFTWTTSA